MRCRFTVNDNKVIATAKYANKIISASAKCHPDDIYNEDFGKQLAEKRLINKIARKRYNYYQRELIKTLHELNEVTTRYRKIVDNFETSGEYLYSSDIDLKDFEASCK